MPEILYSQFYFYNEYRKVQGDGADMLNNISLMDVGHVISFL